MTRNEAIKKARKLRALAQGGATEGEKAAAAYRLKVFLKDQDLTDSDLDEVKLVKVWFAYRDAHEKTIILQAAFKFLNQNRVSITPNSDGKRIALWIPEDRRPYIQRAIEEYRLKFKEERQAAIKALALAFMVKYKLFSDQPVEDSGKGTEYTAEELLAARKFMKDLPDVELDPTRLIAPAALTA